MLAFLYLLVKRDFGVKGWQKALEFIANYGFKKLKMHKIRLHVYSPNIRAIKLYEKFGFVKEGHHTEMVRIDGKYYDEIFMSLKNPKNGS